MVFAFDGDSTTTSVFGIPASRPLEWGSEVRRREGDLRAAGYQPPSPTPGLSARAPGERGTGPARSSAGFSERDGRVGTIPHTLGLTLLAILNTLVTEEIARYGYLAIFVLMLLESACIPIPSEVTMLFGGALVSASFLAPGQQLGFWQVVLAGTAGNLAGSWLAYWAGYAGGRPLIDRWGRYLLIRPHEVDRAHDWFERRGELAVLGGRLLPVVRTFISLPAGVVRMSFWKFTAYTVLGCLPWCLLLTWLGDLLGERWDEVERIIRPIAWAIAVAIVAGAIWFVWHRIRSIRREERERRARAKGVESVAAHAEAEPGSR